MWSEDLSSLTSPTSHYAPSAQTALVWKELRKLQYTMARMRYCVGTIPHQRYLTSLGTLLQHVLQEISRS